MKTQGVSSLTLAPHGSNMTYAKIAVKIGRIIPSSCLSPCQTGNSKPSPQVQFEQIQVHGFRKCMYSAYHLFLHA